MNTPFEAALDRALQATRTDRFDEAEGFLREAMRLDPQSPTPYFLLGANCAQEGRNDAAEAAYIACLSRPPELALARFQLGLLQLTNQRPAAANATWEPLLHRPESDPIRSFVLGFLEILAGNQARAEAFIAHGMALNTSVASLNRDMQGVLDRLRALPATAPQEQAPSSAPEPSPPSSKTAEAAEAAEAAQAAEDAGANHFLIGSYRQS